MALSPDDSTLAANAPEIPALALVLDNERMAEFLSSTMPQTRLANLRAEYVRYKPGTKCLVGYSAMHDNRPHYLYATAVAREHSLKHSAPPADHTQCPAPQMNFIAEMGLGVRHWPADRRIAAAARLNCQAGLEKLWQRLQPEIPAESLALELLRYKPERRLVARVQADECQYLLKAHTAEDFKTIAPKVKQIATYPQVRTAGIVARSWRHAVQLYEWLPGLPLHHASVHYSSAPTRPGHVLPDSETAENIAKVLATLHRAPTAGAERKLASNFPSDSEHTEAARQAIIALVPETETALAHICTQILPILDNPPAHRTLVHNDCSLDQFIRLPDGELALLDWDELDVGDPMTDLAAFAADLYLRASTNGSCQIQSATDWICGFVDAYASAVPDLFCRSRFDAHMAARLLRLAPEPFRRRRLQWRAELIALVELSAASANAPSTDRH